MFGKKRKVHLETERLVLRAPAPEDYHQWCDLRRESESFLTPWEPIWHDDHFTRANFLNRIYWAERAIQDLSAVPLFLIRREDRRLLGAITLDNIRRGPAQSATTGYWIGQRFARMGYMREAVRAVVAYSFNTLDLSRIEAGCLPENTPSRRLLEKCGYEYEGVAYNYLQINGRWRNHVLYANIREDRRGRGD